jgi:hypothetical protein
MLMIDPLTRLPQLRSPLRVVGSPPDEALAPTSLVSTAAAILREELQSLTANQDGLLPRLGTSALSSYAANVAQLINKTPGAIQANDSGTGESLRVLETPRPVAAGDVSRLSLHLENDDAEPDDCVLCVTDLIGPSGHRIPASHVRVSPQPATIPGRGSVEIQIEVRIPSTASTGVYTGLLQTDDGESLRALIRVRLGL